MLPQDHTRVKLLDGGDDYINANHVQFPDSPYNLDYIACQGPLDRTAADMWRMVWQEQANIIVMLTNLKNAAGKEKCARYWPEESGRTSFGPFTVTSKKVLDMDNTVITELQLTNDDEPDAGFREVYHIHVSTLARLLLPRCPNSPARATPTPERSTRAGQTTACQATKASC